MLGPLRVAQAGLTETEVLRMRKVAAPGVAVMALAVGTAVALASSTTSRAPAPLKPGGVKLTTTFGWRGLSRARAPIITGFGMWFPIGSRYNGSRYPSCSVNKIDAGGPAACPKGSVMGSGSGVAYASNTITRPKITVVNGGAKEVLFYVVMNNPARVRKAVVGHISRVSGKFAYHLSAVIPKELRVVAGVPIKLTSLKIAAGKGKWLAITQAPAGIEVDTSYSTGFKTTSLVWVQNS
jgi:hypothetical protein